MTKYERAAMRWLERYLTEGKPRLRHSQSSRRIGRSGRRRSGTPVPLSGRVEAPTGEADSHVEPGRVWPVHTSLEPLVLSATLALIPVLIVEADASGAWKTGAFVANWLIWIVFAVEWLL